MLHSLQPIKLTLFHLAAYLNRSIPGRGPASVPVISAHLPPHNIHLQAPGFACVFFITLLTYQRVCYVCFSSLILMPTLTCRGVCFHDDCVDSDIVDNVVFFFLYVSLATHILWQRGKFNGLQLPVLVDHPFIAFISKGQCTVKTYISPFDAP